MVRFYEAVIGNGEFEATTLPALSEKIVDYYAQGDWIPCVDDIKLYENDHTAMMSAAVVNAFNDLLYSDWKIMLSNARATEQTERNQMGVY